MQTGLHGEGILHLLQANVFTSPSLLVIQPRIILSSLTGYLDIDRSKFTCSIEGQAIIWRSSLLNSSFNKAWSFWNICWMLFLTGLNKMNSVSLLDKYSDMLRNVDCSFVFIVL